MPQVPTVNDSEGATRPGRRDGNVVTSEAQGSTREPVVKTEDKSLKINWLGSSYSGVDIKVVAHLYGEIRESSREKQIAEDSRLYENLRDGYRYLSGISADYVSPESLRATLSGFSDMSSTAVNHLVNFWITFRSGVTPAFKNSMIVAIESNYATYEALARETKSQLEKLQELRANSSSTITLATLQTMSVQSHRQKSPVRAFGMSNVKGWVRGQRTIAGSMIFTMFNEHALAELMRAMGDTVNKYGDPEISPDAQLSMLLSDQLPPIDLTIVFANEYGSLSKAAVYGVEFMNDGYTLSIEDILTEEVINFVARDVDPVISMGHISLHKDQRGMHFNRDGIPTDGSKLLFTNKDTYDNYLQKLGVRRALRGR